MTKEPDPEHVRRHRNLARLQSLTARRIHPETYPLGPDSATAEELTISTTSPPGSTPISS